MKKSYKIILTIILANIIFLPFPKVKADNEVRVQIINNVEYNGLGTYTISGGNYDGTTYYNSSHSDFFNLETEITLTATPGNRYIFKGWYNCEEYDIFPNVQGWKIVGDVLSTNPIYTFTTSNTYHNLMPVFITGHNNIWNYGDGEIAVNYPNSLIEEQDGEHYKAGDMVDFVIGDTITVKARANPGSNFVGWYVSDVKKGPAYYHNNELVSTNEEYTYQPSVTIIAGIDDPINYLTAVFEEDTTGPTDTEKTYTLNDERGNQIIFPDNGGIVFVFNTTDILNLTEEEIAEIANDMGKDIEFVKEMGKEIIEAANNAVKGKGTLVGLYDFSISDGNGFKEQSATGFKIRIKITDKMKNYNDFSIAFLKDDGTLDELIKLTKNGDYLEGTLPHLSTYVIIGNNVEATTTNNPETGDNIIFYIILLGLSIIGIITIGIYTKKIIS